MMRSRFLTYAALNGAISVAGGAFAAHGLDAEPGSARVGWLRTAADYQMLHALALLAVAALNGPRLAGWCFAIGIALFSGSLYLLVITGWKFLGMITPLGGLAFIAGWLILAWVSYRSRDEH